MVKPIELMESTNELKSFIRGLGIDLVGVADVSKLHDMPVGIDIDLSRLIERYPHAIVLGVPYGKIDKSGDKTAIHLEGLAFEVMDINNCLGDNGCTVCILNCPYFKNTSNH